MYKPAYVLGPYTPYIHLEGMPILCCFSDEVYSQCSSRRERTSNDGGGGGGREDAG